MCRKGIKSESALKTGARANPPVNRRQVSRVLLFQPLKV